MTQHACARCRDVHTLLWAPLSTGHSSAMGRITAARQSSILRACHLSHLLICQPPTVYSFKMNHSTSFLFLVVRPLFLVAMPGAPSSILFFLCLFVCLFDMAIPNEISSKSDKVTGESPRVLRKRMFRQACVQEDGAGRVSPVWSAPTGRSPPKRSCQTKDGVDVLIYFWNDVQNPTFCGWWQESQLLSPFWGFNRCLWSFLFQLCPKVGVT